jgi:hypothetical protein
MGRLAGFRYRDIARKLRQCGFEFDRQAGIDVDDFVRD